MTQDRCMVRVRRSFLKTGVLGLAGCMLTEGISRRLRGAEEADHAADSAIMVLLHGGMSHVDSFDPKPTAPVEVRGEFQSIATRISGIRFCEHLPQLSDRADRFATIRGISHDFSVHEVGRQYVLTGVANASVETPSLGAAVSCFQKRGSDMPPYIAIPALEPNAGELGQAFESYNLLGDSGRLIGLAPGENDIDGKARFERRIDLLRSFEGRFASKREGDRKVLQRKAAYREATNALNSGRLRQLADLEAESASVRNRYGANPFGEYLLLARRAIESGSRYVTVVLADWDTHYENFQTLKHQLPMLDQGLAVLIDDLQERGLSQKTMLVVQSEFGRTPLISREGGRDHWPLASCALMMGGGIAGGRVLGETDTLGESPVSGKISPSDIASTILSQLGIDPLGTKVESTGRVLLPVGNRIDSLF